MTWAENSITLTLIGRWVISDRVGDFEEFPIILIFTPLTLSLSKGSSFYSARLGSPSTSSG